MTISTHFLNPFRDSCQIFIEGIKTNLSNNFECHKILQVVFGEVDMTIISTCSIDLISKLLQCNAKIAFNVTSQKPSSKYSQMRNILDHEPRGEVCP